MLNYLTQNAGMMGSPAAFNKPDIKTNPVGSGPYILDTASTVIGSSYTFTKNPNYWDKESQHYDKLVLKVFNDPTAMLNAVKGKQLNGAKLINNDFIDQIKGAGYSLVEWELDWTGLLLLDRGGKINPALKDVRVRQAINYAFDKQGAAQGVRQGLRHADHADLPGQLAGVRRGAGLQVRLRPGQGQGTAGRGRLPERVHAGDAEHRAGRHHAVDPDRPAAQGRRHHREVHRRRATNFIPDILAPKYAGDLAGAAAGPDDWQLINFEITPTATFNPFKTTDPKVTELIKKYPRREDRRGGARPALKELNAYIVEQAWFAPWYRVKSNYATDAKTDGEGAGRQRLPVPVELQAEGLSGGARGRAIGPADPRPARQLPESPG